MKRKIDPKRDPEMLLVGKALHRAAKRAREEARRTGTPLIVYRHGKLDKVSEVAEKEQNSTEKNTNE